MAWALASFFKRKHHANANMMRLLHTRRKLVSL